MPASTPLLLISRVAEQIRALGVREGDVLLVHTSFRAVKPVERGPAGLIEALALSLGSKGTLVMPSWSSDDDRVFDPRTTPAANDLGITAETFWRLPGVQRSDHPFSFAARGPQAPEILSDPLVLPPYQRASPVGRVLDQNGKILLLGVGHDTNTTLHLAELLAGVPYGIPKHITVRRDGAPERIDYLENDHCTERFALVDAWMENANLQSEGTVGHAPAKLMRSQDLVDAALAHLKRDATIFLHPNNAGCAECERAWESIPAP